MQRRIELAASGYFPEEHQFPMVVPTCDIVAVGFEPTFSGYEPDAFQASMAISTLA